MCTYFHKTATKKRSNTVPVNWLQTGTSQMDRRSSHSGTSGESQCFCQEDNRVSVPRVPSVSPCSLPQNLLPLSQSTTQDIQACKLWTYIKANLHVFPVYAVFKINDILRPILFAYYQSNDINQICQFHKRLQY